MLKSSRNGNVVVAIVLRSNPQSHLVIAGEPPCHKTNSHYWRYFPRRFGEGSTYRMAGYFGSRIFLPAPAKFRMFWLKDSSSEGTQNSSPMMLRSIGSCSLKTCGFALTHGAV